MTDKLLKALEPLYEACKDERPDGTPENEPETYDHSKISYAEIIKSLKEANLQNVDILLYMKDLVVAEIAFGTFIHLKKSGPNRTSYTLDKYEELLSLVKLYEKLSEIIAKEK